MSGGRIGAGRTLERLFEAGTSAGFSDADLLERFTAVGAGAGENDRAAESAFEAIVERHGPMVLRVCRTILRDSHAAEDAFQATFLVLARRARTIGRRERLGNWLFGVASRTARKARVVSASRLNRDRAAAGLRPEAIIEPPSADGRDELARIVHEEIERLPVSYRDAVVACYLEGLTQEQAANRLRLTETTVRGRLARARKLLGTRLARRGVAPAPGLASLEIGADASTLTASPFSDAIVRSLARDALHLARFPGSATGVAVTSTAHALAHGVLSTMRLHTFKTYAVATVLAAIGLGLTAVAGSPFRRHPAGPEAGAAATQQAREARGKAGQKAVGAGSGAAVDRDLARLVHGTIVRTLPVIKDCMILAYLPEQNVGHVDNFAMGNNGGGVRMLIDWTRIPDDDVTSPENRLVLALYSRKTTSHPPVGKILGFELIDDWHEMNSWNRQPRYNPEPFAHYTFEPGEGWKLFDLTPLVREQAREQRKGHGILLRFLSEDVRGPNWSGYQVVSREGAGEWTGRRPVMLVVKDAKARTGDDR